MEQSVPSTWRQKFLVLLPAFEERNFRLYFVGQTTNMAGNFMQNAAVGWFIQVMTHSKFWLGTNAFLALGSAALSALFGGIIVDRFDNRKILLLTNSLGMLQAFVMTWGIYTNHANMLFISILTVLLGLINGVDMTARQAFIQKLATEANMASAVALNTTMATLALFIGPVFAGISIALLGTVGTLVINGLTFTAILIVLPLLRLEKHQPPAPQHPWRMLKDGFVYTFSNPTICLLTITSGFVLMYGFSYRSILPAVVGDMFNGGRSTLGILYAGVGCGAVTGGLFVSATSKKEKRLHLRWILMIACGIISIGLVGLALSRHLAWAFFFLFISGAGLVTCQTMSRAVIQKVGRGKLIGRIMGINILMFTGSMAVGNMLIGTMAQRFGCPIAIAINAAGIAGVGCVLFLLRNNKGWFPPELEDNRG